MKKILRTLIIISFAAQDLNAATATTNYINIKVNDGDTKASMSNVTVALVPFSALGEPDTNYIYILETDVNGSASTLAASGYEYFIAVATPGYSPTVRDQMMDPYGNFNLMLKADIVKQYYLHKLPAGTSSTLKVNVSGVSIGDYLMTEVYYNMSGEKAAYGIFKATATTNQMEIYNVQSANAGDLGVSINIPGQNKAMAVILSSAFPQVDVKDIDMTGALPPVTSFETGGSTIPPCFQGVVQDSAGNPIEGARIEVSSWVYYATGCGGGPCWQQDSRYENFTDYNGRFLFYDIPDKGSAYDVDVKKLGFKSFKGSVTMPVTAGITYQLAIATYSLTGILQFNGNPVPSGEIAVYGDWNSYNSTDSYKGNNGMQSDARFRANPDGTFTVSGLPDGNVRMHASFWSSWREFNQGNDQSSNTDDLRIVISSAGANAPATVNGPACVPGQVWVVTSTGTCFSNGQVVFNIKPSDANTLGKLQGEIIFITTYTVSASSPLVVSVSSPITVMAMQDCRDNCFNTKMGFANIAGTFTSDATNYQIILSSGVKYWTKIVSNEWGQMFSFDNRADFSSTGTVKMDFKVTRSGGLKGMIKLPDGTNYRPKWGNEDDPNTHWADIRVDGVNTDVHDGMGIDEFGTFEFQNLAPGIYNVRIEPRGAGFNWPPAMVENVPVTAGKTFEVKLQLEDGLMVQPQIYGLPAISTPTWIYGIIGVNSGEEMNQETITDLFFEEPKYFFEYSTSTGWASMWMSPGQYDFYLILGSKYQTGEGEDEVENYDQFANFIGRVKGVSIQKSDTNPNLGSETQPISLNILGSIGQSQIGGTVKGSKIFTDSDYERMFVNMMEVIPLLPAVMIYDSAGDLKGFSNAMPDQQAIVGFFNGIREQDKNILISTFTARPVKYIVWGLPPGKYTAAFINPNYPPVVKEITLPANEVYNFDFDQQNIITGNISGVVKTSVTLENIENARVYIKHRTVDKFTTTNSSGEFNFSDLPPGIYRMEIMKDGFVTAGQKTGLSGNDSADFKLYMTRSSSTITGKIYLSKFPNTVTKAGIKMAAYDETFNVQFPSAYLPKIEAQTNDRGEYEITGVVPGHTYKISAFYQGKLPETVEATAVVGQTAAPDIVLKEIPPQIMVKVKKSADSSNKVDVVIKSPKELISIPTCKYNPGRVFDSSSAVSLALVPGTGNTYLGEFTLTSGQQYYRIKVSAGDGNLKMEKQFEYDQVSNAKTEQFIQNEAIQGGEVQMDKENEEYTGIELDPGAISYSSGTADFSDLVGGFFSALPSVKTVKTSKGSMSLQSAITSLMASEVYNMDISNSDVNKPFTMTLKYDKEKVTDTGALRIYQYDSHSGTWKEVPGNYTIDPMLGIASVEIVNVANAYKGVSEDITTPLGRKRLGMSAVENGRYVPSASGGSQSGQFAVFTAKPGTGTPYTGSTFEIYNMPNPFNLKTKTVTISADGKDWTTGAYAAKGTIIKYHLPSGKTGNVKLVIYNIAGEKVRTLDEGARTGGQIYYSEWDGKNDKNQDCASGVYFLMSFLDGNQLGSKAHKMAIIK
ncbi:MAG: carboxypeptidase regulatory-like domain-containing protein [Elusimicrobia bacterium]|nr:carboxypeptidase regulatory-like domain-containing protein [Elusimicrobiota bacterium]